MKNISFLGILGIVLILFMSIIPVYVARQGEPYVSISIENYEEIPTSNTNAVNGFLVLINVKNNFESSLNLKYYFVKEYRKSVEIVREEYIQINEFSSKNLLLEVENNEKGVVKYSFIIPELKQQVHFWITDNRINAVSSSYYPEIIPYVPWERQDPYVQEFYRYV